MKEAKNKSSKKKKIWRFLRLRKDTPPPPPPKDYEFTPMTKEPIYENALVNQHKEYNKAQRNQKSTSGQAQQVSNYFERQITEEERMTYDQLINKTRYSSDQSREQGAIFGNDVHQKESEEGLYAEFSYTKKKEDRAARLGTKNHGSRD